MLVDNGTTAVSHGFFTKKESMNNNLEKKLRNHLLAIESESGTEGLLNALKELTIHIRQGKSDKDGKKKRSFFKGLSPSYSSQPTGKAWTAHALVNELESIFGITPQRTNALKEVLGLPLSQQKVLITGLVERLLSQHTPINDRNNTFEAVMKVLGGLGPGHQDLVLGVSQPLIMLFYDDIKKPYINYVGHSFRSADGSCNSINFPNVGKAGNNYVRTVNSKSPANENLPPPSVVFERLLKRPEGQFTPHKSGVNMLLFYLAILITHDLFYTDGKDPKRNLTSSYLDMSFLYGFNRIDQESVRQMKNGLLKNDQWFDKRLVLQPPGVASLVLIFSRNHNYIAKKLLENNENGRFSYGPGQELADEKELDEELFQTARLVNNACFINVVIHDYIRTILGTTEDSDFILDPLAQPSWPVYGNEVSIEFNLIYRWHAAIGQQDEDWLNSLMALFGSEAQSMLTKPRHQEPASKASTTATSSSSSVSQATGCDVNSSGTDQSLFDQLLPAYNSHFAHASPEELALGLPLAGAHRDLKTGSFGDADLTRLLRRGYTQVAGEVGNGLGVPAALETIEIAGIMQGRRLRCCYFNEFREYLNLVPMKTFEDFSEKEEVQTALKELYGTPDKVELYAGLMVERSKVTGLRLPYTMGRAILSDAINLLRNDRILTNEMTPNTLTNWGYDFSKGDADQHGRVFPKLIKLHLAKANADGSPPFTAEELSNLFTVPGSDSF
ncbi:heme peroxidase [Halteromyces radiatus]|uniref:heme peroxidase n=1 Tax=Halteromyces radiatus TaxID=101107 RepID=UPI00221E70D8|nr:heme peroxidase [Halteromyces radiatus]KAI8089624.1 heme peroxidase [Halteromyces radiatus]